MAHVQQSGPPSNEHLLWGQPSARYQIAPTHEISPKLTTTKARGSRHILQRSEFTPVPHQTWPLVFFAAVLLGLIGALEYSLQVLPQLSSHPETQPANSSFTKRQEYDFQGVALDMKAATAAAKIEAVVGEIVTQFAARAAPTSGYDPLSTDANGQVWADVPTTYPDGKVGSIWITSPVPEATSFAAYLSEGATTIVIPHSASTKVSAHTASKKKISKTATHVSAQATFPIPSDWYSTDATGRVYFDWITTYPDGSVTSWWRPATSVEATTLAAYLTPHATTIIKHHSTSKKAAATTVHAATDPSAYLTLGATTIKVHKGEAHSSEAATTVYSEPKTTNEHPSSGTEAAASSVQTVLVSPVSLSYLDVTATVINLPKSKSRSIKASSSVQSNSKPVTVYSSSKSRDVISTSVSVASSATSSENLDTSTSKFDFHHSNIQSHDTSTASHSTSKSFNTMPSSKNSEPLAPTTSSGYLNDNATTFTLSHGETQSDKTDLKSTSIARSWSPEENSQTFVMQTGYLSVFATTTTVRPKHGGTPIGETLTAYPSLEQTSTAESPYYFSHVGISDVSFDPSVIIKTASSGFTTDNLITVSPLTSSISQPSPTVSRELKNTTTVSSTAMPTASVGADDSEKQYFISNRPLTLVEERQNYFFGIYLPVVISVLLRLYAGYFYRCTQLVSPFFALSREKGASFEETFTINHLGSHFILNPFIGARSGHKALFWATILYAVTQILTPVASELVSIHNSSYSYDTEDETGDYTSIVEGAALWINPTIARVLQSLLACDFLLLACVWVMLRKSRCGISSSPASIVTIACIVDHPHTSKVLENFDSTITRAATETSTTPEKFRLGMYSKSDGSQNYGIVPIVSGSDRTRRRGSSGQNNGHEDSPLLSRNPKAASYKSQEAKSRATSMMILTYMIVLTATTVTLFSIVLVYYLNRSPTSFEFFMDSQSFGTRFLLSILGLVIQIALLSLCIIDITTLPFVRLAASPRRPEMDIIAPIPLTALGSIPYALHRKEWFCASQATAAGILVEILLILLPGVPYNADEVPQAALASWNGCLACLGLIILVIIAKWTNFLRARRLARWPKLPSTIGAIGMYVTNTRMAANCAAEGALLDDGRMYEFGPRNGRWVLDVVETQQNHDNYLARLLFSPLDPVSPQPRDYRIPRRPIPSAEIPASTQFW